jgi:putative ABC transport system permease protein
MLKPRWRKVVNDLLANPARTILVMLAIAVGIFAFGGTLITRSVVIENMTESYAATSPATIKIWGSPFDRHTVDLVRKMPDVQAVEGWATYWLKMQAADRWWNVDLYCVENFDRMTANIVEPVAGDWPPQRREIWFERATVDYVGLHMGDMITLELPDGSRRELKFAGIVHDMDAEPPSLSLWPRAFVSLETLRWLGHPGSFSRLNVVTDPSITDLEGVEAVAADITERLERYGYQVGSAYSTEPGEHWALDAVNAFVAILTGIGVMALILSGFLVVNTITSVLSQQKRQIGMMKAVGATGRQIAGVYLTYVMAFGLLSLVIAMPLGIGMAYVFSRLVANFLNIDIVHFRLPLEVFALELGTALVVPVIAALIPIVGGARTTVREAIGDYGITRIGKQGLVDRLFNSIRGLPRPTLLSLRNTVRRKGRLALTLGTLTLAGTIFISIMSARIGLLRELDEVLKLFSYDVVVYLEEAYGVLPLEREAFRVPGVEAAETWAFAEPKRIRDDGTEGSTFQLMGVYPETVFVEPTLMAGRWLEPGDTNAIVVGSDFLTREPDIQVGDEIVLEIDGRRRKWVVVGVINTGLVEDIAYASFSQVGHVTGAPGEGFLMLIGTTQDTVDFQSQVARDLEEHFKQVGIPVSQSLTNQEEIGAMVGQFDFIIGFMLFMSVLLAVVGGLGLTSTMSLNILERTREIGVMRAIGSSNGSVRGIVIVEGILIGLISWALAVPLGIPVSLGFSALIGQAFFERPMQLSYSIPGVFIWLAIALVISTLASLVPARRAVRISVREALAYE